jgi:hypothetical protein
MTWSKEVEQILSEGIFLDSIGVNNWALTKEQALLALGKFEQKKIPVLGGDVYIIHVDIPEPTYDNWYCNRQDEESIDDYVVRSIDQTRCYINDYVGSNSEHILFVLVV